MTAASPVGRLDRRRFLLLASATAVSAGCGVASRNPGGSSNGGRNLVTVESGEFYSRARRRRVAWSISYPPGLRSHVGLPLVLALHPYLGSHSFPMGGIRPVRLLAMRPGGKRIPPVAVAAVDGGNGYWHRHPGDDPLAMLLQEFLPLCRQRGLGPGQIGVIGTSMGGYGALLLAEEHVRLVAAVGVVSPAIWLTYQDSQRANPSAFTSATDFDQHDVVRLARRLAHTPVSVTSGADDPFHPGVQALTAALPQAQVSFPPGLHDDAFFMAHAAHALRFVAVRLSGPER